MRFHAAPCEACGQPVLRSRRRFTPGARVVCDARCKAELTIAARPGGNARVRRLCLCCGETFWAQPGHVGLAGTDRGADICPACWRERIWEAHDGDPYLDYRSGLWGSLWRLLGAAAQGIWAPASACPHCGEPAHRPYEWSCRYPLAVGICEGVSGPHVHSICRRCGYEAVRLDGAEMKKPPHRVSAAGGMTVRA